MSVPPLPHPASSLGRRHLLQIGGAGAVGLTLSDLLMRPADATTQPAISASFGKAKSVIVLFLLGGPPQHETWDPKPSAPANIRGDLQPIASTQPGFHVGELMPKTAKLVNELAVIRSMATDDNAHSASGYWMLTGVPHSPRNQETDGKGGPPNDWPCLGAQVRHVLGDRGRLPAAVTLPENIWNTGMVNWSGQNAGWLGPQADPWMLYCDPNADDFQVPDLLLPPEITSHRIQQRAELLQHLNQQGGGRQRGNAATRWHDYQQRALEILSSPQARQAFAVEQEKPQLREAYGRNRFGQSVLLARRLVEAGVRLVQVNWTRWKHDTSENPAWDTHTKNTSRLQTDLMPPMDAAYSTLLNDLKERGLLDETLVIWMGEFGRTPKINPRGGRDHWGHVYSIALAGAGIQPGVLYGASDRIGGYPTRNRHEPQDLTATLWHCLGISPHREISDATGRPTVLSRGEPIQAILR